MLAFIPAHRRGAPTRPRRALFTAIAVTVVSAAVASSASAATPPPLQFIGCPTAANNSANNTSFNASLSNLPESVAGGKASTTTVAASFVLGNGYENLFTNAASTSAQAHLTIAMSGGATGNVNATIGATPNTGANTVRDFGPSPAVLNLPELAPGFVDYTISSVALHLTFRDDTGTVIKHPELADTDNNPSTVDLACDANPTTTATPAPLTVLTGDGSSDYEPPTPPTNFTIGPASSGSTGMYAATFSWTASTDNSGVTGYAVYGGSVLLASTTGAQTSLSAGLLPTDVDESYTVRARDAAGNVSEPSNTVTKLQCRFGPPVSLPPSSPIVSAVGTTTADLSWTAPPVTPCKTAPGRYDVIGHASGGTDTVLGRTTDSATSTVLTNLAPSTTYSVYVHSDLSAASSGSLTITFTTKALSTDQSYRYALAGAATIRTLVKGALPLTGTADATFSAAGALDAGVSFAPSTATFKALGVLPVVATVQLVSVAPVTGQLTSGSLTATAKLRIKFPSIRAYGVQLGGGSTCQATQPSNIPLKSTGAFVPASGGTLAGTFSISNLSGCGALNGVVSPLTAGGENAISLRLTPAS